ncbi:helix-turn-helix transcriptional regulator [Roseburia sp. BX0805]|uniref:Helix-turn-helix transcriptional regulator n=1 Tax=Roseburia yibonii TaxID=2763063 RepID=A0ABR7I7Z2_9FIRM|nr:helix-turn-helix transcriptional regulator [Roseburia yibonii]MBC5752914.1 helix-turn-helix transcriptional regulator [Roseburia yibonii]
MQVGEVIRKYRKSKNMTQEEMARRLGITAPAVNKWEHGNSLPDITLLMPIARLLGISTDELLSYQQELTTEKIGEILKRATTMLEEMPYQDAFAWAKEKLEEYPNCESLILQMAVLLDAERTIQEIPDPETYDAYINSCYVRALQSKDEKIRKGAADSLFHFYMKKREYEKAGEYLNYFSEQDPARKEKEAQLYSETGQIEEAYKTYEHLLFSEYQRVNGIFHGMYLLALKLEDLKMAHLLVDKQVELVKCFEMGKYYEAASRLELATIEKKEDQVIALMKEMLAGVSLINSFYESPLYRHMEFKKPGEKFFEELRKNLLKCFRDEETYGFLKSRLEEIQ